MPELRKDPVVGRWVIIATERGKRPVDFRNPPTPPKSANCPFCQGNEAITPPEILALREPGTAKNGPGWRVRVVPNKFPALRIEGDLDKRGEGIYDLMTGVGAHEVIIECPDHQLSMISLPEERVRDILWVCRERLQDLKKDVRFLYGLIFKNVGESAGASLEHSHSQLIVTPIVPKILLEELTGCKSFYDFRGRCIYCDMVKQEIESGTRVVMNDANFVAFAPFAARFPFETWIFPKRHMTHFEALPDSLLGELAHILKASLAKIEGALNNAPYNYLIHTSPFESIGDSDKYYHWHVEIIPRITRVAGFEWGTGFYINPVPPEDAAGFLREVKT